MHTNNDPAQPRPEDRTDEQPGRPFRLAALAGLTLLGLIVCALLAYPFLPALAWAVALAVMAFPLHARLRKVIPSANWAAGISTTVVVAVVLVPTLAVAEQLGREGAQVAKQAEELVRNGRAEAAVAGVPYGTEALEWARRNIDVEAETRRLSGYLAGGAAAFARGSVWFVIQALVCVFVLFFAFRDRHRLLAGLNDLSPLSRSETDYLFTRVADAIHATVYAELVLGVVQGVTGGLLFWALGLPAPLLWGVVMGVLGVVPILGGFLVWAPAAVALALGDRWGAAAVLVTWGLLMAGPIGNWLYGWLAGGRMRLHPVPVLIAFVGGLAVFGVSGMVLGPAALAVTMGLLDVWRRRVDSTEAVAVPVVIAPAPANGAAVAGA